jgi:hypothetical protein
LQTEGQIGRTRTHTLAPSFIPELLWSADGVSGHDHPECRNATQEQQFHRQIFRHSQNNGYGSEGVPFDPTDFFNRIGQKQSWQSSRAVWLMERQWTSTTAACSLPSY